MTSRAPALKASSASNLPNAAAFVGQLRRTYWPGDTCAPAVTVRCAYACSFSRKFMLYIPVQTGFLPFSVINQNLRLRSLSFALRTGPSFCKSIFYKNYGIPISNFNRFPETHRFMSRILSAVQRGSSIRRLWDRKYLVINT